MDTPRERPRKHPGRGYTRFSGPVVRVVWYQRSLMMSDGLHLSATRRVRLQLVNYKLTSDPFASAASHNSLVWFLFMRSLMEQIVWLHRKGFQKARDSSQVERPVQTWRRATRRALCRQRRS